MDYVDILKKLNVKWKLIKLRILQMKLKKARDYLMKLPDRMAKFLNEW